MSRFHLFFRASAAAPAATFLASSNERLFFVRSSPEAVPAMSIVDRIRAPIPANVRGVAIMSFPPLVVTVTFHPGFLGDHHRYRDDFYRTACLPIGACPVPLGDPWANGWAVHHKVHATVFIQFLQVCRPESDNGFLGYNQ